MNDLNCFLLRMAIPFTPSPRSSTPLNCTTPAWSACSRFRSWRLLVVTSLFGVQQIESGTLQYVIETRIISVSLTSGSGLDVMSLSGPLQARTHGSFWNDDGNELLRHQRQPKRMEYSVQDDVVYLSAWLMAKSPALGSFRSRSRARPAQWQFRAAAPASFGVHRGHAEAKICPPWYGNILDGSSLPRATFLEQ